MKRLLVALVVLAWVVPASGQELRRPIGIGIAVNPFGGAFYLPTTEVYVPLRAAPNLLIEPSVGLVSVNRSGNREDDRSLTLGVGVFLVSRVSAPVDVYAGGRLKLNFSKVTLANGTTDSGTDVIIAAALGGENFLSPHFSIGLEGQLGYYSNSSAYPTVDLSDSSGLFTTGLAFLRVYF